MTGEVIKSFMVGLGFDVDDSSLAKFNKSLLSATIKVTALYTATNAMAAGIVKSMTSISEGFEQIGYEYKILAPAINKAVILRKEMLKAYSSAGINLVEVVQQSAKLNLSITKTKYAFEALYKSTASKFFPLLLKQSDMWRQKLYANMPKIQKGLEGFIKFVFNALEVVTTFGARVWSILTRIYDFFLMLDRATEGWSTIVLGMIAVWDLLNLSFLATPLGLLLVGLLALIHLYDDFKVWQEGGESFFNWAPFIPVINSVKDVLKTVWDVLKQIFDVVGNIGVAIYQAFQGDYSGAFDSLKSAASGVISVFEGLFNIIHKVADAVLQFGGWAFNQMGMKDIGNFLTNSAQAPTSTTLGRGGAQTANNNHFTLNQQTSINTQPGSDAQTLGKVSSSETKRNFDTTRNFKPATAPIP